MASELSEAHVRSGKVMTVAGPIAAGELGMTLMHEHILNDCRCWWNAPKTPERQYLAESFVCIEILGELRQDPFVNKHNITLDDEPLAVAELKAFASRRRAHSGRADLPRHRPRPATRCGASPQAAGLNIVMGAGYYLSSSHPAGVAAHDAPTTSPTRSFARRRDGVDGTDVRIGLIGEIGVSSDFTAEEEKSLRGAAQAQVRTGLPLMVHLPGWFRLGAQGARRGGGGRRRIFATPCFAT